MLFNPPKNLQDALAKKNKLLSALAVEEKKLEFLQLEINSIDKQLEKNTAHYMKGEVEIDHAKDIIRQEYLHTHPAGPPSEGERILFKWTLDEESSTEKAQTQIEVIKLIKNQQDRLIEKNTALIEQREWLKKQLFPLQALVTEKSKHLEKISHYLTKQYSEKNIMDDLRENASPTKKK